MTILQSLARRYDRLALAGKAPIPGFAPSQISFTLVLAPTGQVVTVNDERSDDKKRRPRSVEAPQAPNDRRGERIVAGTFWDPTDYALGVPRPDVMRSEATAEKLSRKAVEKFAAFKRRHQELLAGSNDEGCVALLRFLEWWTPDKLSNLPHASEIAGHNVAFRLDGESRFIHDREAARDRLIAEMSGREATMGMCLVTGNEAPIARLHPPIKGIGDKLAPLVSFNEDSFTSYGKTQGDNAPVSEAAAFAYATALNALLTSSRTGAKGRPVYPNRVTLGEITVPFWAEHGDAESLVRAMMANDEEAPADDDAPPTNETTETTKLRDVLQKMQEGIPLGQAAPEMHPESKVYVLGLSPNAARLSVRFWVEQSLADFTQHFQQHWKDLTLDPQPHPWPPPLWRLLLELAPQRESKNIPPHLSGDVMRSILTGLPYPRTLLIQTITRIRADGDVNSLRVALAKAVITRVARRQHEALVRQISDAPPWKDTLVALDRDEINVGYRLGRLFALLDYAQYLSVGSVNAGIKEKFFASASSTPRRIFPSILRMYQNHLSDARKSPETRDRANYTDSEIKQVMDGLEAHMPFPTTLSLDDQGRFIVGFYHQRPVRRGAQAPSATSPDPDKEA
jgi:CRISPR-associated protein Csd1